MAAKTDGQKSYTISYRYVDADDDTGSIAHVMQFWADGQLHAVEQLLDHCYSERVFVTVIESVETH